MLRRSAVFSFYNPTPLRLLTVIKMPALSPTMETGNLVSWEMKVGDKIEENALLAKVQTDKATNDFTYVGDECYLARIIAEAGSQIEVGQAVALAVDEQGEIDGDEVKNWKPKESKKKGSAADDKKKQKSSTSSATSTSTSSSSTKTASKPSSSAPAPSSGGSSASVTSEMISYIERSGPAVLRLASSLSTEQISSLFGDKKKFAPSGLRDRFTKSDILKFFPKVDFSKPAKSSPFVHHRSSSTATAAESKSSDKQQQSTSSSSSVSYNITDKIMPGVPGKKGIRDDAVLKYLIERRQ